MIGRLLVATVLLTAATGVYAASVVVNPALLPIMFDYAGCEEAAFQRGSDDPAADCGTKRAEVSAARARAALKDMGAGSEMLQETRRFEASLRMIDEGNRKRVVERTKQAGQGKR